MRVLWLILVLALMISFISAEQQFVQDDDDDFLDFDQVDDTQGATPKDADVSDDLAENVEVEEEEDFIEEPEMRDEEEAVVQSEEDEDDYESEANHLKDEEEFVGFADEGETNWKPSKNDKEPKITVANVPLHLMSKWDSFYLEILLALGLCVYFANFMYGRSKNARLASTWFHANKQILTQHFALVGDDGRAVSLNAAPEGEGPQPVVVKNTKATYEILKESDSVYTIYCSGRVHVHSMMVELKLIKRQDLFSLGVSLFRPSVDEAIIRVRLDDCDSIVMCLCARKFTGKYAKEMTDVMTYTSGERKGFLPSKLYGELSSKFSMFCEVPEAATAILTLPKVLAVLPKHLPMLNYIHISDQYTGPKPPETDAPVSTERPEFHKMLIVSAQLNEDAEALRQFMLLTLGLADKLATFKLAKESKLKTVKNRARVEEAFVKSAHLVRSERAQEKKEEKKREERERMMEIEDPEKQRKWEEKESKKLAKRKQSKVKQRRIMS